MAAIILRNPKIHLSRTLIRLFSTPSLSPSPSPSQPRSKSPISSQSRLAKRSIRYESEPEKIASIFQETSYNPRSYRDRSLFDLSVKKLAKLQRLDLVEKMLEHQKKTTDLVKTEGFWIRIMMLYSNVGMLDQAIRTFDQMEEMKCEQSEKSCCALLSACLENKRYDLVHKYFESISSKTGVLPGIVAHNLVMRAFIAEKKVDSGREVFDKMEVEKETSSYNVMLTGYLKNGEDKKFDELYKEFMEKGLEPNLVTYNLKLSSLCKNKECVRARKLLDEMVSEGVKPNVASFNTVIEGFCKIADFESAKSVLEKLCLPNTETSDKKKETSKKKKKKDELVSPNSETSEKKKETSKKKKKKDELVSPNSETSEKKKETSKKKKEDEVVSPNSETYNILIRHLIKEGEFELALKMCKESLEKKWVPPFSEMKGLVEGLVKSSKENEAKEIVEDMKTKLRGTAPDSWKKVEGLLPLQ